MSLTFEVESRLTFKFYFYTMFGYSDREEGWGKLLVFVGRECG